MTRLSEHFPPKPLDIVKCLKFKSQIWTSGKSVLTYVANLCAFAANCTYKDNLDMMLRDRMVYGINDMATQKHLFVELKLTFQTALEIARSPENNTQHE